MEIKKCNNVLLLFTVCLFLFSAGTMKLKAEEYKLTWSDEFNIEGKPDSTVWSFEKGFVRNKEHQWYQTDNAYCKNGLLVIEARKERIENPDYDSISSNWRKNRKL